MADAPHIVVDLTSLATDGSAGGAWPLTQAIIGGLIAAAPEWRFTLLTLPEPGDSLTDLARTENAALRPLPGRRPAAEMPGRGPETFWRRLPLGLRRQVRALIRPGWRRLKSRLRLEPLAPDLLFCPCGAPNFRARRAPMVCVPYDLQCLELPHLFAPEELLYRREALADVRREATVAVAISEFVGQSLRTQLGLREEQVRVVPPRLSGRLPAVTAPEADRILTGRGLSRERYYFYPANFWPHKNHENLLLAWSLFQRTTAGAGLRLVLTGAASPRREELLAGLDRRGLAKSVIPLGHVSETELAALYAGCRGLVFPSLYEGFGLPLLEAMRSGRPVLAADAASLPEVGTEATIYCDPRRPEAICAGLERLEAEPELRAELGHRGRERAAQFAAPEMMIAAYREILAGALRGGSAC